uniref:CX domain-containing protein n=1 Tax=Steinernema glaseri TaxID=37863 RepID=A0A1I7Y0Q9_9BILA
MRLIVIALVVSAAIVETESKENEICKKNPHLRACQRRESEVDSPWISQGHTISPNDDDLTTPAPTDADPQSPVSGSHDVKKRKNDEEYEYYLWRKFRRERMRRRGYHSSGYYPSYGYGYPSSSYYYPSYGGYSYPSYGGSYYPSYGSGYGGYGYGQPFNLGIGSGLNIGLPYGMGVGIGSGFGISVG